MHDHLVRAVTLFAAVALASACGGDSATGPTTQSVGPDGGTLYFFGDRVSLIFPPGAVGSDVTISARIARSFPENNRVVPETVFDFGPRGIPLKQAVELTISYDESHVPRTVYDYELSIYEVVDGKWERVAGSQADGIANHVFAAIGDFGVFAVVLPATGLTEQERRRTRECEFPTEELGEQCKNEQT